LEKKSLCQQLVGWHKPGWKMKTNWGGRKGKSVAGRQETTKERKGAWSFFKKRMKEGVVQTRGPVPGGEKAVSEEGACTKRPRKQLGGKKRFANPLRGRPPQGGKTNGKGEKSKQ